MYHHHHQREADVGVFTAVDANGILVVDRIVPDGAAKRFVGAVVPGDELAMIDGHDTRGIGADAAHRLLAGPIGSSVTLHLRRRFSGTPFQITLVRGGIAEAHHPSEFNDSLAHRIGVVPGIDTTFRSWHTPLGAKQRWNLEDDHPNSHWATSIMFGLSQQDEAPPPSFGRTDTLPFSSVFRSPVKPSTNSAIPPPPPPLPASAATAGGLTSMLASSSSSVSLLVPNPFSPGAMPRVARWQYERIVSASTAASQFTPSDSFSLLKNNRSRSAPIGYNVTRIF